MKPIFGINKDNRKNRDDNSGIFVVAKTGEELLAEYDKIIDEDADDSEYDKKLRADRRKRTKRQMTLIAIFMAASLIITISTGNLGEALSEDPWMSLVPIVYLFIYIGYMLYTHVSGKNSAEDTDTSDEGATDEENGIDSYINDPRIKEIDSKIYASLGVPDTARSVDILFFDYKTEDGKPVPRKRNKTVQFVNDEMRIFKEGDTLCLANVYYRYEIPLADLGSVRTMRGDFSLLIWNKSTPCDQGEYRYYGMKKDPQDFVLFNTYHILELRKDGEVYGLYFPCYELPAIKELLDITV
ncbi:MAG: hypothetical protein IJY08_06770 [Clostridia bacterium]|nr:hypothetical protein [Clostridia bacterium]